MDNYVSRKSNAQFSQIDRHIQNDKSRGTALNSATALWDNPTTPSLHITVPPGGSYQLLCSLHNSYQQIPSVNSESVYNNQNSNLASSLKKMI